jgi:HlyD family secretion protein
MSTATRVRKTDEVARFPQIPERIPDAPATPAPVAAVARNAPRSARFWWLALALVIAIASGGYTWWRLQPAPLPAGIVSANGRLEAIQLDVATKLAGRIESVLVNEGDLVEAGQVIAKMDTTALLASLSEAQAQHRRAITAVATANAVVEQRRSELVLSESVLKRTEQLVQSGFVSSQKSDADVAQARAAQAALIAARSQVTEARATVAATLATIKRIEADIEDSALKAPKAGRVQYRLAEPGEVLAAGGKLVSLLDLTDVYMIVFLPETTSGRVALGSDVRVILDAAPEYVIPASVTFVADEAQFTPKTVETASERQKLMFRMKARIDAKVLREHRARVNVGLPGLAYVRVNRNVPWPQTLAIRLPPAP